MSSILSTILRQLSLIGMVFLTCFALHSLAATQQANVTVTMRDHGYTMGDVIQQKVQVHLPRNEKIDPQSLPLAGYINPWLDLKNVSFNQDTQTATLRLDWQIFATVEFTQVLKTPEFTLKTSGKNPQKILIPGQPFYYSSVLPQSVADIQRRPNLPPLLFDTFYPTLAAGVFALMVLLGIFLWCWLQDKISWLPYAAGPITKLARQLKGQPVIALAHADLVYQALNQSAEKNIYLINQADLFKKAAYLKPYQTEIQQFIHLANQVIYQHQTLGDTQKHEKPQNFGASTWVAEAAMAERLFRRQKRQQKNA